ncbi:MAG: hypothetical protein ABI947_27260 [Chloroflexota bacterium]
MIKPKLVVAQLKTETMHDFIKFRVFVGLGATRSLDKAYKIYYETNNDVTPVWHVLADKNHWEDRAAEHDKTTQPTSK